MRRTNSLNTLLDKSLNWKLKSALLETMTTSMVVRLSEAIRDPLYIKLLIFQSRL